MGAIAGYGKGRFPGRWLYERTCAAATIAPHLEDRFDAWLILEVVAPAEGDWDFLLHRARVLDGREWPSANGWRQALTETWAWGQMHMPKLVAPRLVWDVRALAAAFDRPIGSSDEEPNPWDTAA